MSLTVRRAIAGDEGAILRMIRALAAYEREPDAVKATEASIAASLFVPDARVHAHLAELDGRPAGLALWFMNYSTWTGRPGLYLEDLFVDGAARQGGIGRALFRALAREALDRGCARVDFAVLDWNSDAMAFYRRIGARGMRGWQPWRLDEAGIRALAGE